MPAVAQCQIEYTDSEKGEDVNWVVTANTTTSQVSISQATRPNNNTNNSKSFGSTQKSQQRAPKQQQQQAFVQASNINMPATMASNNNEGDNSSHDGHDSDHNMHPPLVESDDLHLQDEELEKPDPKNTSNVTADSNVSFVQTVIQSVAVVFPKLEPLPWHTFLILSVLVAIPTTIYILIFTKMGFGLDHFYWLDEKYGDYASTIGGLTTIFFLACYMLDLDSWDKSNTRMAGIWFERLCGFVIVMGVCLTVLFMAGDYPYGPIAVFAFVTPLWLISMGKCWPHVRMRVYVSWLSGPLFFVSLATLLAWLIWVFAEDDVNDFNQVTNVVFAQTTGCLPNLDEYPECASANATNISSEDPEDKLCFTVVESPPSFIYEGDNCDEDCPKQVYSECLNGFILWGGPLLVCLVLFFLSFFCTFLRSENSEGDIVNFVKLWIFLLSAIWLTASLAGVAAGLSSALLAMTLASFVGSAIFAAMTRSKSESKDQGVAFWKRIRENYGKHLNIARGLFLVTCAPIVAIYLVLSFFNQLVRKLRLPCSKELKTEAAKKDFLTKRTRKQVTAMQSWNRTEVLTFAIYWGIFFVVMVVVVAKFTVLFLSWLIEATSSMNLAAVTGILVFVGMIMFLLPPVPGVPIYLTLGIVVLATGREQLGLVGAMAYASAVSLALKLVACTAQQKGIGEALSQSVGVRKATQINSSVVKAMRLLLGQPGMGLDKVSILVGGPDWPTSVLCGIMRLNLIPVLVGTLPVFILILPTVLTGSFTYMAGLKLEDGSLEFPSAGVMATVFAAVTAVVQFGAMLFAAYYLEYTMSNRSDEIDAIPVDEEVAALEAEEVHYNNCFNEVTKWEVVPTWARLLLYTAFITMVACCYLIQMFGSYCFTDYQLTYTIDEHLDGDWKNLVKPLGWAAILLFVFSCDLLWIFKVWASRKASALAEETDPEEEPANAESESHISGAIVSEDIRDKREEGREEVEVELQPEQAIQ